MPSKTIVGSSCCSSCCYCCYYVTDTEGTFPPRAIQPPPINMPSCTALIILHKPDSTCRRNKTQNKCKSEKEKLEKRMRQAPRLSSVLLAARAAAARDRPLLPTATTSSTTASPTTAATTSLAFRAAGRRRFLLFVLVDNQVVVADVRVVLIYEKEFKNEQKIKALEMLLFSVCFFPYRRLFFRPKIIPPLSSRHFLNIYSVFRVLGMPNFRSRFSPSLVITRGGIYERPPVGVLAFEEARSCPFIL